MLHGPILAALTDTHLYFADKFLNLDFLGFPKILGKAEKYLNKKNVFEKKYLICLQFSDFR